MLVCRIVSFHGLLLEHWHHRLGFGTVIAESGLLFVRRCSAEWCRRAKSLPCRYKRQTCKADSIGICMCCICTCRQLGTLHAWYLAVHEQERAELASLYGVHDAFIGACRTTCLHFER